MRCRPQVVDGEHPEYTITRATPKFDDFICYIYEIDLDHHTYHYGGFPKFRLDNLPEDEIFEESIGKDGFGHPMLTEALPEEHMYKWRAILPPKPLDIKAYEAYKELTGKFEALQAMLDAHSTLTNAQESCVRLYEIIAGAFVTSYALHSALSSSELYCDDGEDAASMPPFVEEAALKFLLVAFLPMHYPRYFATAVDFLAQDSVLQGAVGDLVQHIHGTGKQGVAYGVLCSLFRVVIVRVDMDSGRRFEHAPALTFLPPRCRHGPWAQGIDALMKLSFHLDVDPRSAAPPRNTHMPTHFDKFPLEIVQRILADTYFEQYSTSPAWLIALGSRSAVAPYVFRPTTSGRALTAVVGPGCARWKWMSELFEDHAGRCCEHRHERCGMYVGRGDLLGTPIFEVGQAGALSVAASHITLAELHGLG
ncbi:hypothetical protein BDN71DRAFT_1509573 [Pleurotus eryngii]|uniref:Uncharacterized protein n=1 Tax=Pleurotus eryngii TaxID=5323 RepID=A0A9P5ZRG6_PLEER|nr:hypothetical protein BDN71DRAFT_1509573 [Pleurotus eryngii]